jgi:hypothetical protein
MRLSKLGLNPIDVDSLYRLLHLVQQQQLHHFLQVHNLLQEQVQHLRVQRLRLAKPF